MLYESKEKERTELGSLELCKLFMGREEAFYSFDVLFSFEAREVIKVGLCL